MDTYLNYNIDIDNIKNKDILKLLKTLLENYKEQSRLFKEEKLINQDKLEKIFKIIFCNMINSYIIKEYKIFYYRSNKAIQIRKMLTYHINHKYLLRKYNLDIINYFSKNKYIILLPHSVQDKKLSSLILTKKLIKLFDKLYIDDMIYDLDTRQYSKGDRLLSNEIQIRIQKKKFKLIKEEKEIMNLAASKKTIPKDFNRQNYINKVIKLNNISSNLSLDKKINKLKDNLFIINNLIDKSTFKIKNFSNHETKLTEKLGLHDKLNIQLQDVKDLNNTKILPKFFFKCRRIFNNWSLISGGRLYSRFQFISRQIRKDLLINDQRISSIDLQNSHPRMLYHLTGYNISTNIDLYKNCNPYNFPNYISRKINKFILMLLMNSKRIFSEKSLNNIEEKMLTFNIDYDDYFYRDIPFHNYIKYLIYQNFDAHPKIQNLFHTKVGLLLQFIESEVLIDSIIELINNYNVLALPIHDELIVDENYKEIAKEYIKKNYNIRIHKAINKNYYKKFTNQFNRLKKINKKSIDIPKIILEDKNIIFEPSFE